MAGGDLILKNWGRVEADYPAYGNLILTRYFGRYPEDQKLFPRFQNIAKADFTRSPLITALGIFKLKKIHEILLAKGNRAAIVKALATMHGSQFTIPLKSFRLIAAIIAEVVAEKSLLDPAGQQALIKEMELWWKDFDLTYKELGFTF